MATTSVLYVAARNDREALALVESGRGFLQRRSATLMVRRIKADHKSDPSVVYKATITVEAADAHK